MRWLVGCIEDYVALAVFQSYRDLEAGDNPSLKFKWRGGDSNPGNLAPQVKSLTTWPPLLLRSKRITFITNRGIGNQGFSQSIFNLGIQELAG